MILLAGNSHAQQAKQAGIRFDLNLTSHEIYRSEISSIDIEAKDKLNEDQSPRRIRIVFSRNTPPSVNGEAPPGIDVDQPVAIEQNAGRWFRVSWPRKSEVSTKFADSFFQLSDVAWLEGHGSLIFTTLDHDLILSLKDLSLPPSVFKFTASLNEEGKADLKIIDTERAIVAGQSYAISTGPPEQPGAWEAIKDKLFNKEGFLITIIIGLVGILIAVLKDKISAAVNRMLDRLGKYGSGKLAERRFLKRYLDFISFNHKYLRLVGFSTAGISRPLLQEVFVSLRISSLNHRAGGSSKSKPGEDIKDSNTVSFATALKQNRKMVILGGPGAGKTTTLSYALLTFAQQKGKERFGIEEDLLPIFVPLRRLSNTAKSLVEDLTDKDTQILSADILKECPPGYFEKKLDKGECLVLLDGMDEVVDEATLQQVAAKINNLISRYPQNRYVVTCRIAGWKPDILSGEFAVLQTQDFNRDEIQRFVVGWHKAVITQSELSRMRLDIPDEKRFKESWEEYQKNTVKPAIELQSRKLINAINANNRILAIAVNPMLLSLISLVHYNRDILPRGRTILYSQCIELLIEAWDRTKNIASRTGVKITTEQKEAILREIAFAFQLHGKGEDTRENVERLITSISQRLGISVPAAELLSDIEQGSGLLIERSIDVFGFSHLTLQEYLVAKHIQINPSLYSLLVENFDRQEWREVILLYAGLMADATQLVRDISSAESLDRQILAGYCIGDALQCDGQVARAIVDSLFNELRKNNDKVEELINVLSAIAADYDGQSANAREGLSNRLIEDIAFRTRRKEIEGLEALRSISILGQAKITHALPTLINLIRTPNSEIRYEVVKSLIAFGNLALPALEKDYDETMSGLLYGRYGKSALPLFEMILLLDEDELARQAFKFSLELVERMLYVKSVIDILSGINTGQSAKLLLKLYDQSNAELHELVSINLARMLANPFVEADLQELSFAQLPESLRTIVPDGGGWSYDRPESKKPFLIVDTKIRGDICSYIMRLMSIMPSSIREGDRKLFQGRSAMIGTPSFKIMYPSFLRLRRELHLYPYFEGRILSLYRVMGFDADADQDMLRSLLREIDKNPAWTLEYALRSPGRHTAPHSISVEEALAKLQRKNRFSAYFVIYFLYLIMWIAISMSFVLDSPDPQKSKRLWFMVVALPVGLLLALMIIAYWKWGRQIGTPDIVYTFFTLLSFIHEILPYLTKMKIWRKFVLFHAAVFCCIPVAITTLLVTFYPLPNRDDAILFFSIFWIPYFLFLFLSFRYFKYHVLPRNPIYDLMLYHPEGRKLLNTA